MIWPNTAYLTAFRDILYPWRPEWLSQDTWCKELDVLCHPKVLEHFFTYESTRVKLGLKAELFWHTFSNGKASITLPLAKHVSPDRGDMVSLMFEFIFPSLANVVYNELAKHGMAELVAVGRPEAIIPTSGTTDGDPALAHFKTFTRQARCLPKCADLEVVHTRRLDDDLNINDLQKCWSDTALYHACKDGIDLDAVKAHNFGAFSTLWVSACADAGSEFFLVKSNGSILACVEYVKTTNLVTGRLEIQWRNTYMQRTEETRRRSLGNFCIYQLLRLSYAHNADLNLGFALYDYKADYKPTIVYQPGIKL